MTLFHETSHYRLHDWYTSWSKKNGGVWRGCIWKYTWSIAVIVTALDCATQTLSRTVTRLSILWDLHSYARYKQSSLRIYERWTRTKSWNAWFRVLISHFLISYSGAFCRIVFTYWTFWLEVTNKYAIQLSLIFVYMNETTVSIPMPNDLATLELGWK